MEDIEKKKYEMMVIVLPNLGEDKTKKELDEVRELISSIGGEIYHEDLWGQQRLAYKIKKQEEGYYAVLYFTCEGTGLSELDKALNINQAVLRYLLLKSPTNYSIKTMSTYVEEEKKRLEEEKKEKEKESNDRKPAPAAPKPQPKAKPEPKAEPEPKPKVELEESAEEKSNKLAEVDEKLKNIINDPDISL